MHDVVSETSLIGALFVIKVQGPLRLLVQDSEARFVHVCNQRHFWQFTIEHAQVDVGGLLRESECAVGREASQLDVDMGVQFKELAICRRQL